MKRRTLLGVASLGAFAAGIGWSLRRSGESTETAFVDALGGLRLETPGGGLIDVGALRGKPLLLNFWATWCVPCVTEMPLLDRFYRDHRSEGREVLAIAIDNKPAVEAFVAQRRLTLPVALGGPGGIDLARKLGNGVGGLPFSAALDRSGRVQQRKTGGVDADWLAKWVQSSA